MQPNEFDQGCDAMKLVAIDTLRAVLEDHFGPNIDMSPLAMDIYEDFCDELEGRV